MSELEVKVRKVIRANRVKVFDAWLDPISLSRFMMPMKGMPEPEVSNDPKEGGKFEIIMDTGESKLPHTGEYLEIVRPERLVFSWHSAASPKGSQVAITFKALADNETELELVHTKFLDEERRNNHERGWSLIVETLSEIF